MKNAIAIFVAMLALNPLMANAETVCGKLSKANVSHTLQGVFQYYLHVEQGDQVHPYIVQAENEDAQEELEAYSNSTQVICVTGQIGFDGDNDLIQATGLEAGSSHFNGIAPKDASGQDCVPRGRQTCI